MMNEKKQYAQLLRVVFGEKDSHLDEEAINGNEQLAQVTEELLEERFDPMSLEYIAVDDIVLEGKQTADFADYIRRHADEIAALYMSKAIRPLRHPQCASKWKPFLMYRDE